MKLTLEKIEGPEYPTPWYRIIGDGKYLDGSYNLEDIEKRFEDFKNTPELTKIRTNILRSEEI